jgi:hypothetical protein
LRSAQDFPRGIPPTAIPGAISSSEEKRRQCSISAQSSSLGRYIYGVRSRNILFPFNSPALHLFSMRF